MLNEYTVNVRVGDVLQQVAIRAKNQDAAMDEALDLLGLDYATADEVICNPAVSIVQRLIAASTTLDEWEKRVCAYEDQGITRSDAQAIVDAEDQKVK